ncbi:MAG: metalloregulator ArsR/SmtB family transcription factor [Planctomycetota bacterium]
MDAADENSLNLGFAALADPTRRAILDRLQRGPATLAEIAEPFDMSVPAVAKHLAVLERAGFLVRGRRSRQRPVAIDPRGFQPLQGFLARHQDRWNQRLDRLGRFLDQQQSPPE